MRNPSSRSSSVRSFAAVVLLGAALVVGDATAPAAHAIPRSSATPHGSAASGSAQPGVARRIVRPQRRIRPQPGIRAQRRFTVRAARSANRIRPLVARRVRRLIPLTDPVWAKLRACESGGRYNINTGNGFYGAYQFVPSTWRGLGYPGMPHLAPPHVQDEAAQKLQARSGWGQWPACTRKLGLR